MKQWGAGLIVLLVVAVDQSTGYWARQSLSLGQEVPVLGQRVAWQLLYNKGAMLGMGAGSPRVVDVLAAVVTVLLITAMVRWRFMRGPLALMAGGGLGNLLSRLVFGKVTDFIRVAGYPGIFNVADVALRVGVLWFIVAMILDTRRHPSTGRSAS